MEVKTFRISGVFNQNRIDNKFKIDVRALDEAGAKDKALMLMGSKHKLKRSEISIESVAAIAAKDSKSFMIQQLGGE
jgi:ribosomal protein L20A (L18A)